MERRNFIKKTAATATFIGLNGTFSLLNESKNITKIVVLHTNDVHSHIDSFPADHPRNPNMGGAAKRAYIIEKIRKENKNVLLLDAGDSFQGTPYFNYYEGELELKVMNMMQYDATTIGNHEFDNGIEHLSKMIDIANFDFLNSNYDISKTPLSGKVKPYKIIQKEDVKIGIFGLGVELNGLVNKEMYGETIYNDPVETCHRITQILKTKEKCDYIICLSHLGYEYKNDPEKISDLKLAALTQDIDLIIGGHTHTFLEKPTEIKNLIGQNVLINQVGCYGLYLGKFEIYFEKGKKKGVKHLNLTV
jgi:5'-nucleotidase